VGIDIEPQRIKESNKNAKDAKVDDKVEFREGDVLKLKDVSEATVVTLYLFPEVNEALAPMLRRSLKPGSRIVSHDFLMGDWGPGTMASSPPPISPGPAARSSSSNAATSSAGPA